MFPILLAASFLGDQGVAAGDLSDPLYPQQWHLRNATGIDLHLTNTWRTFRGRGVVIGIVDDGIDATHPDLAAHIDPSLGYDWNDDDSDPSADPAKGDFHGTECAGAAAAVGNNAEGVAGVAFEATIAALRLISDESTDQTEAEAILFKNQQIHVKSNSWGPDDDGQTLEGPGPLARAALAESVRAGRGGLGTIFLWPAGNGRDVRDDANYDGYANSIYTIAVGAVSDQGFQTDYSEPGACVVVTAPSGSFGRPGITTTDLQGDAGENETGEPTDYENLNYSRSFVGTSASVALGAGAVALVLNANPGLGWRDVQEILIRSAARVDAHDLDWEVNSAGLHFNHKFGAGLIDVDAAVGLALQWSNLAPQTNVAFARANLNLAIPDNRPEGVSIDFDVARLSLRVEHATLTARIKHPARGNLAITLISPSGMESRLAEPHDDPGADFSDWTFMSVRHWGESAQGVWRVRIADLTGGEVGTVQSLRLELFGTDLGPPSPVTLGALRFSDQPLGNGNGGIEPGETITGSLTITNLGPNLPGGTAWLSSGTPEVTVVSGQTTLPPVNAGDSAEIPVAFVLAESVPCQSTLIFHLITDFGGIRRTNSFRQKVGTPPAAWSIEAVDQAGIVGSYTSLALDALGKAHVSYYDTTNGDLKYARQDATGWIIETVEREGDVGTFSSLALNSVGQPRISYRDVTRRRLKYAAWNGSAWEVETVPTLANAGSYCSLALTRNDEPRIAFMDETNGDLLYARRSAPGWEVETVDAADSTGSDVALALNARDEPAVSYRNVTLNDLKFAQWKNAGWQIETIDSAGSVGFNTALKFGQDGEPRIAYRDSSNADLKFAQRSVTGWKWEVVDSEGAVGYDASLALDGEGRPRISYRDVSNNTLKYAAWNGSFWSRQTVDADGSVGSQSSIALDPSGRVRISYRDTSKGNLKFASLDTSDCQVFRAVPRLSIRIDGALLILAWPTGSPVVLEQSTSLRAPDWAPANLPFLQGSLEVSARPPLTGRATFYRLRRTPAPLVP